MSDGSCPRCGQGHALSICPYGEPRTLARDRDPSIPTSGLPPGTMVGEYQVTGLIGEGGMGQVYAGVHPLIGRKVAIKVISGALSRSDEAGARFLQEARAATALHHRNIVDVFAFGQLPDGRLYQVMEFLEGATLRKLLDARGALAPAQTRVIARAILEALDAAHRGGVIHRDIKPDNVIVSGSIDGPLDEVEVRILDFGLAKQQAPGPGNPSVVTRDGFPMGTPAYMSPEQCRSVGSIDARTDLYAAGIVLFEMLTGRLPFESDAALEVMTMQIDQPPPRPSSLAPVPLPLEQVVLRALAKQPDQRYESAALMLGAFERACRATPDWRPRDPARDSQAHLGVSATPPAMTPARGKGWLVTAAVAVTVAVVLVMVWPEHPAPVETLAPPVTTAPIVEAPPRRPTSATVRVSLTPPGRIYLDGRLVGSGSDVSIPDVPLGPHALRTEATGHLADQRTFTVSAPVAVAIALKPMRAPHKKPAAVTRRARPAPKEADLEAPINPYQR